MSFFERDLFQCDNCGLISSNLKTKLSLYGKGYADKYLIYEHTEIGRKLVKFRSALILEKIKSGSLLDFGCGAGNLIRFLLKHSSLKVMGWDINPYLGFRDPSVLFFKYDIVTFFDSFEHLTNPRGILETLNPNFVFISVPSLDDISIDQIFQWRHYRQYEHIHHYCLKSLKYLLINELGYKSFEFTYGESQIRKGGDSKNILTVIAGRK